MPPFNVPERPTFLSFSAIKKALKRSNETFMQISRNVWGGNHLRIGRYLTHDLNGIRFLTSWVYCNIKIDSSTMEMKKIYSVLVKNLSHWHRQRITRLIKVMIKLDQSSPHKRTQLKRYFMINWWSQKSIRNTQISYWVHLERISIEKIPCEQFCRWNSKKK